MNPFLLPSEGNTRPVKREGSQQEQNLLEAALTYADAGIPVFPVYSINESSGKCTCWRGERCEHPGKHPRTKHGFYDAAADEAQIKKWWELWPDANIGIPTGERSGFIALDIDTYKQGGMSPEDVEAQLGPLPDTRTIRTGRGGLQLLYRHPEGKQLKSLLEGKLGPGVCVKASGGCVIAPPSRTEGTYEILADLPLADPPTWLLEAAKQPVNRCSRAATHRSNTLSDLFAGEPIPEGQRDNTLTSIAGRLHDGSRRLADLEDDLLALNERRCAPPLPPEQVCKIARSIHHRPPCRTSLQRVTPEILEALDTVRREIASREWQGRSGPTDYDVMIALERIARRKGGEMIPAGLRVEVSIREIVQEGGIGSTRTASNSLNRLRSRGCLRRDGTGKGPKSGAIVILIPPRAKGNTRTIRGGPERGVVASVSFCAPPTAPRLRWSAPGCAGRLGKRRGRAVDVLEAEPILTLEEIAQRLGHKRPRDVRRRILQPLVEAGVVVFVEGRYSLATDWRAALDRRREEDGEIEAAKRQKQRHEEARRAFREAWEKGEVIGKAERRRRERWRILREEQLHQPEPERADGTISELERVEAPELTPSELADLEAIRRYECSHGPGSFLWDQASAKRLFYSAEGRGRWPDPGELERIRAYVDAAASLEAVA